MARYSAGEHRRTDSAQEPRPRRSRRRRIATRTVEPGRARTSFGRVARDTPLRRSLRSLRPCPATGPARHTPTALPREHDKGRRPPWQGSQPEAAAAWGAYDPGGTPGGASTPIRCAIAAAVSRGMFSLGCSTRSAQALFVASTARCRASARFDASRSSTPSRTMWSPWTMSLSRRYPTADCPSAPWSIGRSGLATSVRWGCPTAERGVGHRPAPTGAARREPH